VRERLGKGKKNKTPAWVDRKKKQEGKGREDKGNAGGGREALGVHEVKGEI